METERDSSDGSNSNEVTDGGGLAETAAGAGNGAGNGVDGEIVGVITRDGFIKRAKAYAKNPTVEQVPLPWLGQRASAYVRGMSADERDGFEMSLVRHDPAADRDVVDTSSVRAKFLVRVLCGPDGTRLFTDEEFATIATLDARTAEALFERGRRLSGFSRADIEELAGNSGRARSGNSSFSSGSKSSAVSPTS